MKINKKAKIALFFFIVICCFYTNNKWIYENFRKKFSNKFKYNRY